MILPGAIGRSDGWLATRAPAKLNLTLHVLGRRADGYHALESLVVFAGVCDRLSFLPGEALGLSVSGTRADGIGAGDDNLVLKAARALADHVPGLELGTFHLIKRLPVAAGIGGGSADAAAALRLLARHNRLAPDDSRLVAAARATGADVPVCLAGEARMMRGAGEDLGPRLMLPPLFAVLVNPGVAVATAAVFRALGLKAGESRAGQAHPDVAEVLTEAPLAATASGVSSSATGAIRAALIRSIAAGRNDMEAPAKAEAPVIDEALALLRASPDCRLARMSGSGATVFGLFDDCRAAARARQVIAAARPAWWAKATLLR